jgi:hypothetical protein
MALLEIQSMITEFLEKDYFFLAKPFGLVRSRGQSGNKLLIVLK